RSSPNRDIGWVITNRQIAEKDLIQKRRHHRLYEGDPPFTGVKAEPKTDLQHIKGRRSRPGMRGASDGIKGWPTRALARKSAEQFGKPPEVDVAGGREQAFEDPGGFAPKPVARKSGCEESIVMGPDRTVMITHRIVAGFRRRNRAHTPSAERRCRHQAAHDRFRPVG